MKKKSILFILKKRQIYSNTTYSTTSSGLFNSANFVNEMLVNNNVESNIVQVVDNNEIDKHVTKFKPNIVIIEALWVVPEKFEVLQKLHPNVKWVIRLHSEIPFIANEGIAIKWLKAYQKYENVEISSNSKYFIKSMTPILGKCISYLPNYYPITPCIKTKRVPDDIINVGLFGAIRPLKNALTQAVAAMLYADEEKKTLNLHINSSRIEQDGENTLKNIKALFANTPHQLIEHGWLNHCDFIKLVATMDLGLQVSLSETYNIVTADMVNQGIPVITSKEISFINMFSRVKITKDAQEIKRKMRISSEFSLLFKCINKIKLFFNSKKSEKVWLNYLKCK